MSSDVDQATKLTPADLKSDVKPIWCPGCGDFGVLNSFYKAVAELELDPNRMAVVSGIGCSGRFPAFVEAYGFHGVHGRVLPLATGVKLGNPELTVYAVGGDGDAFSIGAGHLPHMARRNVDVTYIVMDNEIYGLTKGQPSPTSPLGMKRKASPYGSIDAPIDPLRTVLAYGATFVARGFSSRPRQLIGLIKAATRHEGFAFIQVMSPCVTYYNTYDQLKETTRDLPEDHDTSDLRSALTYATDPELTYLGLFYQEHGRRSFTRRSADVEAVAQGGAPLDLEALIQTFNTKA
jgi:2-oxoglutarate ferredoxin oxidoreductase subunit beta